MQSFIGDKKVFDPRVITEEATSRMWTTESIALADEGLAANYALIENPYLKQQKKAKLRKANLSFQYSEVELDILEAVYEDKEFFCDNFGVLKSGDAGWININLYDYQRKLLKQYSENRWNLVMFPRQMGKTTTTVLEILHYCLTNKDKDIIIIAKSDLIVGEILSKILEAFAGLPFFMQPGFVSFTADGFMLDNGCRCRIGIASESIVQGFSIDFLYIDEFAYIKPSVVKKFWDNIYPALSKNHKSKVIITSTPNGRNLFYLFWKNAEAKRSKFKPFRIYWQDLDRPEGNEQFKADTIANTDITAWEMGFECSFDTQLKSVFNSKTQKSLRLLQSNHQEYWGNESNVLSVKHGFECIDQSIVNYDIANDYFLLGIDIAEGLGQDSSVIKLKKLFWSVERKRIEYRSVALFRSNTISVDDLARKTLDISKLFDKQKIQIIVETNNYGGEYFKSIDSMRMFESDYGNLDMCIFAKFVRKSKNDYEFGIRWDGYNKKIGVKALVDMVSSEKIIEDHYDSIEEYFNFGCGPNDKYAAQYGHDDLVMADVCIAYFIKVKNIYSAEFINTAISDLRTWMNDEAQDVIDKRIEAQRKIDSVHTYGVFKKRNHKEMSERIDDDILCFSIQ